ncbi:hypothetical protein ACJX0J_012121 [Zea mays]
MQIFIARDQGIFYSFSQLKLRTRLYTSFIASYLKIYPMPYYLNDKMDLYRARKPKN